MLACRYEAWRAGEITYGTAECLGWPATWVVRGGAVPSLIAPRPYEFGP